MRLLHKSAPVACSVLLLQWLAVPVPPARSDALTSGQSMPGPVDYLYAAPGDVNYAFGPSLRRRLALQAHGAPTANITVSYTGFPAGAQAAFQAAVDIWSHTIVSPAPIRISASYTPMGDGVLGSAGPSWVCQRGSSYYAAALADKLAGSQYCAAQGSRTYEIGASFNSSFSNWDFGTSGAPVSGKYNFLTVVMHEIAHGLGFFGSMYVSGGVGEFYNPPDIYDRFAVTGGGVPLLGFDNPSTELGNQLVSNNTFFNGANARAGNSGVSPKLETHYFNPDEGDGDGFQPGSSYSHIDDALYTRTPNGLMTWALNMAEVYTDPGPIVRGMFLDEGWTLAAATSCTYAISPASVSVSSGSTAGSISVSTQAGCAWTANSNASFLSISSPASGTGSGAVSYSIAGNPSTSSRSGTLSIAGQTFIVFQEGRSTVSRPPLDFDGDGLNDIGVFRPEIGRWFIRNVSTVDSGNPGDIPVPGDYNGDRVAEIALFRPSSSTWHLSASAPIGWGAPGDIPVPADYDGNGRTDIAIFRPSTGTWYIRNGATIGWGAAGDVPVPADYDGDGRVDIAVFRPSTRTWYIHNVGSVLWGIAADVPVPADYNGDGIADIAVFRPATGAWYIKDQYAATWGAAGDVPVPIDRDGDGLAELAVFRRSTGTWLFRNHASGTSEAIAFGRTGDIPLGGPLTSIEARWADFDGDRKADLTVFRPSTGGWLSLRSLTGMADSTLRTWGLSTDTLAGRDYDGDGRFDPAVFRPSTGLWYVLQSSTDFSTNMTQAFGASTDTPVPADYDGDGRADIAVFRGSGIWFILLSSSGNANYIQINWGQDGDIAVPADYDGDGRTDLAVFRPSIGRWFILNRFLGTSTFVDWGLSSDLPVVADFDGDRKADITVFRPSIGRWFIKSSMDGSNQAVDWGLSGDDPVPADYDGDGKADVAVFRPSTSLWYVRGQFNRTWELGGDVPAVKIP